MIDAVYQATSNRKSTIGMREKRIGLDKSMEREKGYISQDTSRVKVESKEEL